MRSLTFLAMVACSEGARDSGPSPDARPTRVVLAADTHLIDDFYTCCESTDLDTSSLQLSEQRMRQALDAIEALDPPAAAVFVAGDVIHEYPSSDLAFFDQNRTSFDIAADFLTESSVPIHYGLGNHDYDTPEVPRATSLALFEEKWGIEPWYEVRIGTWSFLHLDCQAGPTWIEEDPAHDEDFGSFGREQLAWVDERLAEGNPTVLLFHNPPQMLAQDEDPGGPFADLWAVLDAHPDAVRAIFSGHLHMWLDTSSGLPVPGWGLAATRFDHRNWWIMDLNDDGTFELPQEDDVNLGSFFYDDAGDGLDATLPPPSPLALQVHGRDLAEAEARAIARLAERGLTVSPPHALPGGARWRWVRGLPTPWRLVARTLDGQAVVAVFPTHTPEVATDGH